MIMCFTGVTLGLEQAAYAISPEQRRIYDSGIYFYDRDVGESTSSQACELSGSTNAEKAWNFLIGKDLTAEQAAGVLGNLEAESAGINPTLQELVRGYSSRGDAWDAEVGGWGIAQWTAGRRKDPAPHGIRDTVIEELGREYYTMHPLPDAQNEELLSFQLEFMYNESNNRTVRPQPHPEYQQPSSGTNEWEGLKMMQSVEDATHYWEWNFERPGVPHTDRRLAAAQDFLLRFGSGGVDSNGGEGCVGASLGDLQCPTNLEAHPTQTGYFRMPTAPNDEYIVYSPSWRRWGSQEIICVLYSMSLAYYDAMDGESKIRIGNLNTPLNQPSRSHRWGVANDLSAEGIQAASWNQAWKGEYSEEATVLIGKLLVDSKKIKNIWWCPPDAQNNRATGGSSQRAIREYAESIGESVTIMCVPGHSDHFHVDLKDRYRLDVFSPSPGTDGSDSDGSRAR